MRLKIRYFVVDLLFVVKLAGIIFSNCLFILHLHYAYFWFFKLPVLQKFEINFALGMEFIRLRLPLGQQPASWSPPARQPTSRPS